MNLANSSVPIRPDTDLILMNVRGRSTYARIRWWPVALFGLFFIFLFASGVARATQETHTEASGQAEEKKGEKKEETKKGIVLRPPPRQPNRLLGVLGQKLKSAFGNTRDPLASEKGELFVAPVPVIDPTVGTGLAGVGGYIFRPDRTDKESPPTILGGGGFATSNGTWGALGAVQSSLARDRYRLESYGGYSEINYNYYGQGSGQGDDGVSIPLNIGGYGAFVGVMRRTFERVFIGPTYQFLTSRTSIDLGPSESSDVPEIPDNQLDVSSAALGLHLLRDTRDNMFYPRTGTTLEVYANFYGKSFGGDFAYQKYRADFNLYRSLAKRHVIAYHAAVCAVDGDTPFFDLCMLGAPEDLRGYRLGRYQDTAMWATQAEYRLELPYRFGVNAFVGVGEVTSSLTKLSARNWLPGGGFSVKWIVAPANHINIRADFAWGRGSSAFYVSVGETF